MWARSLARLFAEEPCILFCSVQPRAPTGRIPLRHRRARSLLPLAQVVKVSSRTTGGYSAQQAQLDYQERGDSLLLEVHIELTPSYNQIDAVRPSSKNGTEKGMVMRTEDFWQNFRYGVKQKKDWIDSRSTHSDPEYGSSDSYVSALLIGAWVYLHYDAPNVPSDDTEVHVFTPDGQDVSVTFDLSKLH